MTDSQIFQAILDKLNRVFPDPLPVPAALPMAAFDAVQVQNGVDKKGVPIMITEYRLNAAKLAALQVDQAQAQVVAP